MPAATASPPPGHTALPATLALHWPTEADTQAFAQCLARQPQLRQSTLTLHGDLGAGKTTFVRHLLRALGVQGRIKSPTYAVVEPHQATLPGGTGQALDIWHFDFYRFDDPREWEDAGFRDLFASPGLKLVEWPEKAGSTLPTPDLALHILTAADDSRHATLVAHTPVGHGCLAALATLGTAAQQPAPLAQTRP